MPRTKKLTDEQVYWKVDSEGLGYAVQFYMAGDSIANPELAKLWDEAAEALDKIQSILDAVELTEDPDDE